jgi:DNA-binding winged helix-turn-helix (wHTH) protein/Tfp pilus assembly protein PilF
MAMADFSRLPDRSMTMAITDINHPFILGDWTVDPRDGSLRRGGSGELRGPGSHREPLPARGERLEPRVMRLLLALAAHGTELVSRDTLMTTVWPDTVVGDDALARTLLKLRRALGDDARAPRYVETVPRRGYRLMHAPRPVPTPAPAEAPAPSAAAAGTTAGPATAPPAAARPAATQAATQAATPAATPAAAMRALRGAHRRRTLLAGGLAAVIVAIAVQALLPSPGKPPEAEALLERAHDYYYRFDRRSNESAAALYQRLIDEHPGSAAAKAGLANVLVQRVIRWPEGAPPVPAEAQNIRAAQASGRLDSPWAHATLDHAERLAREAVALAPDTPLAHKALGLVLALRGDTTAAAAYERALALDPGMWEAWLNLGELVANAGDPGTALTHYVKAYEAMRRRYADDPQRIGRWQAELGVLIGETQMTLGRTDAARAWFGEVLDYAPLHPGATAGLAAALVDAGDPGSARALCTDLVTRIGPLKDCEPYLPPDHQK